MKRNGAIALIVGLLVFAFVPPGLASGPRHGFHHRGGFHHGAFHHRGFHHRGFHHHGFRRGFRHHGLHHRGFHHHGFRSSVVIGFGPAYFRGYRPHTYLHAPPPAVVQRPTVYVQQAPATGPLETGYWYYCQSAGAYYPTAPSCQEAWVKVPPRTE